MGIISKKLSLYLNSKADEKYPNRPLKKLAHKLSVKSKLFKGGLKGLMLRNENIEESPVDVLFIHEVKLMKRLNRKQDLIQAVKETGQSVKQIEYLNLTGILKAKSLYGESQESLQFKVFDRYAQYIIKKYSPKVIVTETNGDLAAPFFKKYMKGKGYVIHTAHSVLTAESNKYSLIDYDYYLLYGKSSHEYLNTLNNKFGQCNIVYAGSYLFKKEMQLPEASTDLSILLLGMGPAMEEDPSYAKYYDIILEWITQNPSNKLDVRMHPRSNNKYWQVAASKNSNITVRPKGESFKDSCKNSFMCITSYTNAVVDAAILGRPSLLICDESIEDYLQTERFYSPRISNSSQFNFALKDYKNNYSEYRKKAGEFAGFHVEKGANSFDFIKSTIVDLAQGRAPKTQEVLIGEFSVEN